MRTLAAVALVVLASSAFGLDERIESRDVKNDYEYSIGWMDALYVSRPA